MELHSWQNGFDDPAYIVYVSDNKNFQYAFPFNDEDFYESANYYSDKMTSEDKERILRYYNWYAALDYHLTYICDSLKISDNKTKLNRFVSLFADSLLHLKPISAEDTNMYSDSCKKNFVIGLSCLKQDSVRYYNPKEGDGAIWKFKVDTANELYPIKTTFLNRNCYRVFRW